MGSLPRGAHDGMNANSFGFTWMGYFHTPYNQTPSTAQRNALYDVVAWRMPGTWRPYGSGSYGGRTVGILDGHRAAKATACPGDIGYGLITTNYSGGEARNAVNARITGGGGAVTYTIDNNSATFVGTWAVGSSAADKYGADYRYKSTGPTSEPATWPVNIATGGNYDVSAWWPAGSNRSATAPYILPNGASSPQNQQINGGKWNVIGTQSVGSGANTVKLSIWTSAGFIVVADAVRLYGPK